MIAAFAGDPRTAPPSYRYFVGMVQRLRQVRLRHLTDNAVPLGRPAQIGEILQRVAEAGVDEVILYFNVGLERQSQVKTRWPSLWPGCPGLRRPMNRTPAGPRVVVAPVEGSFPAISGKAGYFR